MKKVLVCGGRTYSNRARVYETLDALVDKHGPIFIIQGGATGADTLAADWADVRGMPCAEVKAPWRFYGKSAGPRRNAWMLLLKPDIVVAMPGEVGTSDMRAKAMASGIELQEIKEAA